MNTQTTAASVPDIQTSPAVAQVNETTEADITTTLVTEEGVTQKIIAVPNPTKEEMQELCASIKANHDYKVTTKPVNFNFKKSTDDETKIETVRNSVQLAMAYPSFPDGIIAILEEGESKGVELLQEAMEKIVNDAARAILYEDVTLTAATFPYEKISWQAIADQPKAQRRGGGIPKETWEGFGKDYMEVMPEVTGKTLDHVANAARILVNRLSQVKTNLPVLNMLVGQLALYADNSPQIDEYRECVEFLLEKADTFLNLSDEELLANLQ